MVHGQYCVSEVNNMISIKRPEENYKFIFKRCLKYMKEKLKAQNPDLKLGKKEFEKWFHQYYFQEVVDEILRDLRIAP